MSHASEPAFPGIQKFEKYDDELCRYVEYQLPTGGLTKREYFAAVALQSSIQGGHELDETPRTVHSLIARDAVAIADALLAELEKARGE